MADIRLHKIVQSLFFPASRQSISGGNIADASRILILKPDEIGDVVLASQFLKSVRRQCPKAHITLMVRAVCRELVMGAEFANEIIDLPEFWRGTHLKTATIIEICRTAHRKWSRQPPDWVLIPRSGMDVCGAGYYAWWTGAPNVCVHQGFRGTFSPAWSPLFNHVIRQTHAKHEVIYHQAMLAQLGLSDSLPLPCYEPEALGIAECATLLAHIPTWRRPVLSLGIGAGMPDKVWPLERFIQLAQSIHATWPDALMVVVGGAQDAANATKLCSMLPESTVNAAGQLSLNGTLALLSRCQLHIGNDSGPMHLAASVGTPVVGIFKHPKTGSDWPSHSPVRFGPLVSPNRIVQPHPLTPECTDGCINSHEPHCILNVSLKEVFVATSDLLGDLLPAPHSRSADDGGSTTTINRKNA